MELYKEESLSRFEIEEMLEELYPDGLSETDLNDIFWLNDDLLAEIIKRNDEKDAIALTGFF